MICEEVKMMTILGVENIPATIDDVTLLDIRTKSDTGDRPTFKRRERNFPLYYRNVEAPVINIKSLKSKSHLSKLARHDDEDDTMNKI